MQIKTPLATSCVSPTRRASGSMSGVPDPYRGVPLGVECAWRPASPGDFPRSRLRSLTVLLALGLTAFAGLPGFRSHR